MPGLYSRVKNWIAAEIVTYTDLNAEFNNIITKFEPQYMDDISANVTAMQAVSDPGSVGSETLPVNLAEELKSLRSMIKKITGESIWYTPPDSTISFLATGLGGNFADNRIDSGRIDANSQPQVLIADGSTLALQIDSTPTNLAFTIAGVAYSKIVDATQAITAGFSSANTGLVLDTSTIFADLNTKNLGEFDNETIYLGTVGAELTTRGSKLCAFSTTNGTTEYFLGRLGAAGTTISECRRGFFFNSSATMARVALVAGQTITILRLTWIFIKTDGTFLVTTNEPFVLGTTPSGAVSGDMWFNTVTKIWMLYSSGSFISATATFLGWAAATSAAVVAVRTVDFYANFDPRCDLALMYDSNTALIHSNGKGGKVSVYGTGYDFGNARLTWDTALDMDTALTFTALTVYYFYITNAGLLKISDVKPYDRQEDLRGWYHPHKPWRCIAHTYAGAGPAFADPVINYGADSLIADHSITLSKLAPLSSSADNFNRINRLQSATVSLTGAGSTSILTLLCTGRPVMIVFSPIHGSSNAGISTDGVITLKIQKRKASSTASWTDLSTNPAVLDASASGTFAVPGSLVWFDAGAGDAENIIKQYKMVLAVTSGATHFVRGFLYAIEL